MKKFVSTGLLALFTLTALTEADAQVKVTSRTTSDTVKVTVRTPRVVVTAPAETLRVVTVDKSKVKKAKKKRKGRKVSPGNSAFGHSRGKNKHN